MMCKKILNIICLNILTCSIYCPPKKSEWPRCEVDVSKNYNLLCLVDFDYMAFLKRAKTKGYSMYMEKGERALEFDGSPAALERIQPYRTLFRIYYLHDSDPDKTEHHITSLGLDGDQLMDKKPLVLTHPGVGEIGIHYYNGFMLGLLQKPGAKQLLPRFVLNEAEFAEVMKLTVSLFALIRDENEEFLGRSERYTQSLATAVCKQQIEKFIRVIHIPENNLARVPCIGYRFYNSGARGLNAFIPKLSQTQRDAVPIHAGQYKTKSSAAQGFVDFVDKYYDTHPHTDYLQFVVEIIGRPANEKIKITYFQPVADINLIRFMSTNRIYCPDQASWNLLHGRLFQLGHTKLLIRLDGANSWDCFTITGLKPQDASGYIPLTNYTLLLEDGIENLYNTKLTECAETLFPSPCVPEWTYIESIGDTVWYTKLISNKHPAGIAGFFALEEVTVDLNETVKCLRGAQDTLNDWDAKSIFYVSCDLGKVRSFSNKSELKRAMKSAEINMDDYVEIPVTAEYVIPLIDDRNTFEYEGYRVTTHRSFGLIGKDGGISLFCAKHSDSSDNEVNHSASAAAVAGPVDEIPAPIVEAAVALPAAVREVFQWENFAEAAAHPLDLGRFDLQDPSLATHGNKSGITMDPDGEIRIRRHGAYVQIETAIVFYIKMQLPFITHYLTTKLVAFNNDGAKEFDLHFFVSSINQALGLTYQVNGIYDGLMEYVGHIARIQVDNDRLLLNKGNMKEVLKVIDGMTARVMYNRTNIFILYYDHGTLVKVYRLLENNPAMEMEIGY